MDNDDTPVGRILGRREALALFGAADVAALVACTTGNPGGSAPTGTSTPAAGGAAPAPPSATGATGAAGTPGTAGSAAAGGPTGVTATPACIVRPAMTEGPFFVDDKLNRSDIRPNSTGGAPREGVPLELAFNVARMGAGTCDALAGALVDVWQCDARGVYSAVNDPRRGSSVGQDFLRGLQVTDAAGVARFTTVYPGWYRGRAVHIHFKIRARAASGAMQEFTSQLFFDDALSDRVLAQPPYNAQGTRDTRNDRDGIFRNGGSQLLLQPSPTASGYAASFAIGLQIA